jgi:competence protein ComEA
MAMQTRVNVNTAELDELITVDGIDEEMAVAIIEFREDYGAFGALDELLDLPEFDEALLEDIRDSLTVGQGNESDAGEYETE